MNSFSGIHIVGISSCVPKNSIKNESFDFFSEKDKRFFEKTVGITERKWSNNNCNTTNLAHNAGKNLLNNLDIDKSKIKSIIFISQTPDQQIPFTSNILQSNLGLNKDILAIDLNSGCAGFIQGLITAFSLTNNYSTGEYSLLILSETLSKKLDKTNKTTAPIFGDGAAAVLIEKTNLNTNKSLYNIFSEGDTNGYIKLDKNEESKLFMDGSKVFDFTMKQVFDGLENFINKNEIDLKSLDKVFFHQSNKYIIKQLASKLNISIDKVPTNIEFYGNTSSVSIPLLISECFNNNILKDVIFTGYGSGLNWGNFYTNLETCQIFKPELI